MKIPFSVFGFSVFSKKSGNIDGAAGVSIFMLRCAVMAGWFI
jgi:hypothetical protein